MLDTSGREIDIQVGNQIHKTPIPIPEELQTVKLSDNARTVLMKRYIRRGVDGEPIETIEQMFWRIATRNTWNM